MTEAANNKAISYSNLDVFKQAQDAFNRNTFTRIVKVENKEDIPANANPHILYLVEETVQNKVIYQKIQEIETASVSRDQVQDMIDTTLGDIEAQLKSI